MSNGRIIKIKQSSHFVQIPNSIAQSPALSSKEKGLLLCLMSLPDDWKIHKDQLSSFFQDGRDSIRTAFQGLVDKGFIRAIKLNPNQDGTFAGIEYQVSVVPFSEISIVTPPAGNQPMEVKKEAPPAGAPPAESPTLQTNNDIKKEKKETVIQTELHIHPTFEEFWEAGLPKMDKERAKKYWDKIPQKVREKIMEYIPKYVDSTDDKKYLKSAATFLNQKAYENEIIDRRTANRIAGAGGSNQGAASGLTVEGTVDRLSKYS